MIPDTVSVQTGVTGDCTLQFFLPGNSHAVKYRRLFSNSANRAAHTEYIFKRETKKRTHKNSAVCAARELATAHTIPTKRQRGRHQPLVAACLHRIDAHPTPAQRPTVGGTQYLRIAQHGHITFPHHHSEPYSARFARRKHEILRAPGGSCPRYDRFTRSWGSHGT